MNVIDVMKTVDRWALKTGDVVIPWLKPEEFDIDTVNSHTYYMIFLGTTEDDFPVFLSTYPSGNIVTQRLSGDYFYTTSTLLFTCQ